MSVPKPQSLSAASGATSPLSAYPPPAQAARQEEIKPFLALLENSEQYLRAMAQGRGMGVEYGSHYVIVPLPAALAEVFADLLFSKPPTVSPADAADQDRLDELWQGINNMTSKSWGAAREAVAAGDILVKTWVDRSTPLGRRGPRIGFIPADQADLKFKAGELIKATLTIQEWDRDAANAAQAEAGMPELKLGQNEILRLLEIHEPGRITLDLRRCHNEDEQGLSIALDLFAETKPMADDAALTFALDEMFVHLIPVNSTARSDRGTSIYAGLEDLFLAINEAVTLNGQNFRAAQPVVVADKSLLMRNGRLPTGAKVITSDKVMQSVGESEKLFDIIQPKIAAGDLTAWEMQRLQLAALLAGVPMQALGLSDKGDTATSGTAMKFKLARTLSKGAGIGSHFERVLATVMRQAAWLDKHIFGTPWKDVDGTFSVELHDGLPEDNLENATVVTQFRAAGVMSIEAGVRFIHKDWTDQQVEDEVARIEAEQQTSVADHAKSLLVDQSGGVSDPFGLPPLKTQLDNNQPA